MRGPRLAAAIALVSAATALPAAGAKSTPLLPGFGQIDRGPDGGTVWQGTIPNRALPWSTRPTVVYLPPGASAGRSYPVLYFLHGFPGSPYEFVDGLRLAPTADEETVLGEVPPFIAVVPPAGFDIHHGDWVGIWENYLVQDVVPWVDAHLPTIPDRRDRTLGGLSSGGYGALDIGLRHPELFGTLEAWSGYFKPLREGSLADAGQAELAAHDPSRLVRREAARLRALGTRFFLYSGTTHDRVTAAATKSFSAELRSLGLPHRLWLAPGGHDGAFWRAQLPGALRYALSGERA